MALGGAVAVGGVDGMIAHESVDFLTRHTAMIKVINQAITLLVLSFPPLKIPTRLWRLYTPINHKHRPILTLGAFLIRGGRGAVVTKSVSASVHVKYTDGL